VVPLIGKGHNYKQDLTDSIADIPTQTAELMEKVEQSHIFGTQKAMGLTLSSKNSKSSSHRIVSIL
jgi:hypothetical protein